MINRLKEHVLSGKLIDEADALLLSEAQDKEALYEAAHIITQHYMSNRFDTCSIVNAKSGNCSENCKWCAQSKHYPTKADVYPLLSEAEIVKHAKNSEAYEIKRFSLVTSGRHTSQRDLDKICASVAAIKRETGLKCCASLGLLTKKQLTQLKENGVENYHCNIESAPSYFPNLCTTHTIDEKVATLRAAREVGMRLCSGGIIGMGETTTHRIEMALYLRKLGVLSIPINLLQPIEGTPLMNTAPLTDDELLTTIALFRFINPTAYLRFSGGRSLMSEAVQQKALYVGINAAIMGDLLTTVASQAANDRQLFASAGYALDRETDWEG